LIDAPRILAERLQEPDGLVAEAEGQLAARDIPTIEEPDADDAGGTTVADKFRRGRLDLEDEVNPDEKLDSFRRLC